MPSDKYLSINTKRSKIIKEIKMDLQYYGGNCVRITTKDASLVIDDNLESLGLKSITKPDEIALFTKHDSQQTTAARLLINQPGEYEVSKVSIQGVAARAHMDEEVRQTATMFKIVVNDLRIAVVGHIYPDLSDAQLEALGMIDVLVIPVGNSGFTLDALGALKVIKKIEPKIIIPVHYADSKVKYEVPQTSLVDALKEMSMEAGEAIPKLKLKAGDLPENAQLVVLERQ